MNVAAYKGMVLVLNHSAMDRYGRICVDHPLFGWQAVEDAVVFWLLSLGSAIMILDLNLRHIIAQSLETFILKSYHKPCSDV